MADILEYFNNKYEVIINVNESEKSEIKEYLDNLSGGRSKFELLEIPYIVSKSYTAVTLIEYMTAYMFKKYKKIIEEEKKNCSESIDYDKQKNMLDKYQLVMKSLKYIYMGSNDFLKKFEDDLEALSELVAIIDIKENLNNLVEEYLKLTGKKNSEMRCLIVIVGKTETNLNKEIRQCLFPDSVKIFLAKNENKKS